ncbi:MAG: hypothetical protein JNG88_06140, partial [Phycisphaerales bacterium]|nr:hypothetical protein [Phycisphaerales bacterium]
MRKFAHIGSIAVFLTAMCGAAAAQTQTAAITYQGQLKLNDVPVDGSHNAEFRLFATATGGSPIGTQAINGLIFENGLFSVALNDAGQFGATAFNGQQRWLEAVIDGQVLSPRQALTTAPYAAFSLNTRGLNVATNGNVGIGGVNPSRTLHLSATNDAVLRLQSTGGSGRSYDFVSSGANGQFRMEENGNQRILMLPGGFTNFGNGTPDRPLCVAGVGSAADLMTFQNINGSPRWFLTMNGGGLNVGEVAAGNPTRMYFAPGGQIGIGTTNPTAALEVAGTVKASILHITGGSDIAEPYHINAEFRAQHAESGP